MNDARAFNLENKLSRIYDEIRLSNRIKLLELIKKGLINVEVLSLLGADEQWVQEAKDALRHSGGASTLRRDALDI